MESDGTVLAIVVFITDAFLVVAVSFLVTVEWAIRTIVLYFIVFEYIW